MSELKMFLATNIVSLFLNILGEEFRNQAGRNFVRFVNISQTKIGLWTGFSKFPGKDPISNTYSQVPHLPPHSLALVTYQHTFS